MHDAVELIGKNTLIQHGEHNNRIYLLKLDEKDGDIILNELSRLAEKNSYTKIFCKLPKHTAPLFFADGYVLEAYIPGFYNGQEDALFVSRFLSPDRLLNIEGTPLKNLSALLKETNTKKKAPPKAVPDYHIRQLDKPDVEQMAEIYREVFLSYPFPIHHPDYILKTMDENVQYYGAEKEGQLVALASSEMDIKGENAEMTDFATVPEHHGNNLAGLLLGTMETEMKRQDIKTLYTIARLNSIPMNKTFLRAGYNYSGTLIKNTNISGSIESMNVYYKHI